MSKIGIIITHPDLNLKNDPNRWQLLLNIKQKINEISKTKNVEIIFTAAGKNLMTIKKQLKKISNEVDAILKVVFPNGSFYETDLQNLFLQKQFSQTSKKPSDLLAQISAIEKYISEFKFQFDEILICGLGRNACSAIILNKLRKKFPNLEIELGNKKILWQKFC